jgi:hypothetical protein
MKTFGTLFVIVLISFSMNSQEFKFEKETIDYGKIAQSSNGERTFVFKNIGEQPIIINKIQSSCGCTVPEKPEKPVMPGEQGEIKVSYDTKRMGGFSKQITIYSNAKTARKIIKIKGYVEKGVDLIKEKSLLSNR